MAQNWLNPLAGWQYLDLPQTRRRGTVRRVQLVAVHTSKHAVHITARPRTNYTAFSLQS